MIELDPETMRQLEEIEELDVEAWIFQTLSDEILFGEQLELDTLVALGHVSLRRNLDIEWEPEQ